MFCALIVKANRLKDVTHAMLAVGLLATHVAALILLADTAAARGRFNATVVTARGGCGAGLAMVTDILRGGVMNEHH